MSLIPLPETLPEFLKPYLPYKKDSVFITLTYAQSLDAKIAARLGVQTKISHLETKSMTHYIRSHHDAILVGIGTVLADDPKLNCRFPGAKTPRPVILDPRGEFVFEGSTLQAIAKETGVYPFILVDDQLEENTFSDDTPTYIRLPLLVNRYSNWQIIIEALKKRGIRSLMVEGGAVIINELLRLGIVDSVIVTIGPVYLGADGVGVAPSEEVRLKDVAWWGGIQDGVVAGRIIPHQ